MVVTTIISGDELINPIGVICTEENLEQVTTLLKLFMSSFPCRKELITLSLTQDVKVNVTNNNLKFQGCWLEENKEIRIKRDLPLEKMLQTFIFELCNANNPDLISRKIKYSNFSTADEYATHIEKAEHQSFKKASSLYMDIISRNPSALKMPSAIELKQLKMLSEEETYLIYVKTNGHYDYYVNNYKVTDKRNNFFYQNNRESESGSDQNKILQLNR